MKWDCGPDWPEKKAALEQWHRWFAWRPIRIDSHDCRWLEMIERRGELHAFAGEGWWEWKYRALDPHQ
jgi:hypothetical protein